MEGFGNAFGEVYLCFWELETPHLVEPETRLPLPIDFSNYAAGVLNRGWFLTADTAQPVPRGQATLALAFQIAQGQFPSMQAASFALAKAEFDKARMARSGWANASNKPSIGVVGTSATAGATTTGASRCICRSHGCRLFVKPSRSFLCGAECVLVRDHKNGLASFLNKRAVVSDIG